MAKFSLDQLNGVDVNKEIALFEYGILAAFNEEDNDWFFVYGIGDGQHFGCGYLSEKEINGMVEGTEWMDADKIESFLSFVGMDKESWLACDMVHKVSDLYQYWGAENIFGTDYSPSTKEEIMQQYFNN